MTTILTFIEVREGEIKAASLQALSEAHRVGTACGMDTAAVIVGSGLDGMPKSVERYGATTVYIADHPDLALYSPEGYAQAVATWLDVADAGALFLAATAMGKDLAGRIAGMRETAAANDCIDVSCNDGTFSVVRPMYAGKTRASISFADGAFPILSLRPNVFKAEEAPAETDVVTLDPELTIRARTTNLERSEGAELDVTEARVIVSGGRAMKGPENFPMLKELAQLLGGALGASRAAVDAGWIDHQHQVGQTGKTVSPDLYIACGISGAIQHLAGMSSSKVIVAINKDPDAPIFQVADYGIVADLFDVVPHLIKEAEAARES